eukprot:14420169-Alexandrium_andersonii.AAC.1
MEWQTVPSVWGRLPRAVGWTPQTRAPRLPLPALAASGGSGRPRSSGTQDALPHPPGRPPELRRAGAGASA